MRNIRGLFWPVLCGTVLVLALIFGARFLSSKSTAEGRQALEERIRRAAVECYALEGRYPGDLDYLTEHYGVTVESGYFADYRYQGDNLMPDITVLER